VNIIIWERKNMYKRKIVFYIFLILFIGISGEIMAGEVEHFNFSIDEIEILDLVLDSIVQMILLPENETLLINRNIDQSRTNVSTGLSPAQLENSNNFRERYLKDINDDLWQSLHSYNSKKYIFGIETTFKLSNYRLVNISDNDRRGNLRRGEHFPLLSFSRIGFSNDRTEAILEINYFFPLAGSGYIIHLKKEDNIWRIINRIVIWIS
jgi:hypothetical protein